MVEKLTFNSLPTAQVDIPAVSMPIAKLETSMALCCVTKLYILKLPLVVPSTRCTCVMIKLFNQILDMPHLTCGWVILAKEKCSLTGM